MSSHGKFVWYELMTTDLQAAEAYYRKVIGWEMRDSGMTGMRYTLASAGEIPVAGLMELPEEARAAGARPGWVGYVGVDDVDGTAAQIQQAGGTVHRGPADIPGVGRFAIVSDPQRAMFALFKLASEPQGGSPPPATRGHGGWHELYADDREAAFEFYSKLFGWTKAEPFDMGPMGIYQIFAWQGQPIGGIMTKPPEVPAPAWLYYFNIDSIDAAKQRVGSGGGQVINGPVEVPGGSWILQCADPQGAMYALVGPS
jgi:predicted enzyme related to lactoylglutathione lyase